MDKNDITCLWVAFTGLVFMVLYGFTNYDFFWLMSIASAFTSVITYLNDYYF